MRSTVVWLAYRAFCITGSQGVERRPLITMPSSCHPPAPADATTVHSPADYVSSMFLR